MFEDNLFLIIGVGFFLAIISSVLRDITSIVGFASMGLMMLTPILYPMGTNNIIGKANVPLTSHIS